MCISQNNSYKQHRTMDFLQKPVTYSKSLVHLSKVFMSMNISVPSEWKVLVSLITNNIVKMLHVVNIIVHSTVWWQYCTEMQKAALLMYVIYPFQKYTFTHYCMRDSEWKRLDRIHSYTFTSGITKIKIKNTLQLRGINISFIKKRKCIYLFI